WDHQESAQKVVAELKALKAIIDPAEELHRRAEDLHVLYELAASEDDAPTRGEADAERGRLSRRVEEVELMALLSGTNDPKDCYFSIQAGAGGTEACDWSDMLFRMYLRYFEKQGYKVEELGKKDGDGAGISSVDLKITGEFAFGYLKCEHDVRRLVR